MEKTIELVEAVSVKMDDRHITVSGPKGQLKREFYHPFIKFQITDKQVELTSKKENKSCKMMMNTFAAHIQNMIIGVTKGYRYKLAIVYVHFPMRVRIQGDDIIIENFLGEKTPRATRKFPDVTMKIEGKEIIVEGINIEHVGQTAANLEIATKIRSKDRRVFKDGIYLTERGVMDE
ncbi:MAG: 50S ribosomal protein L6 [Candidatus Altiarchaeota archaeon]|nr:50S ribosomal protein L6 [Candidatus Altiarchaeota archaeon]